MTDIKFTGSSNFEKIKSDYEALAKKTAKVEAANARLTAASKRQGAGFKGARREQDGMISSGLKGLASMATGYLSVATAVQVVNAAIESQNKLRKASLDAHVSKASSDAQVIKNLVGETSEVKKQTLDALQEIAKESGVGSVTSVNLGFSAAISKASGDRELALDATRRATQLNRLAPEDIDTYAGAGVTMSKLIGTRDSREALGFLSEVQARSPVVDPKQMAMHLPSAVAAVTAFDEQGGAGARSTTEAGALFAALGQATQQKAAPTGTASIQFTGQLDTFFDKLEAAGEIADPGTLAARLDVMQSRPDLQQQFGEKLTGEAAFLPAFRQLIEGGDSIVAREWEKNTEGPGALKISADAFEALRSELGDEGLTPSIRLANQVVEDEGKSEGRKLRKVKAAEFSRIGAAREELLDDTQRGPLDYVDVKAGKLIAAFGAEKFGAETASIRAFDQREHEIRRSTAGRVLAAPFNFMGPGAAMLAEGVFGGQRTDEELSDRELGMVKDIQEERAALEQDMEMRKQELEETKRMNANLERMGKSFDDMAAQKTAAGSRADAAAPIR